VDARPVECLCTLLSWTALVSAAGGHPRMKLRFPTPHPCTQFVELCFWKEYVHGPQLSINSERDYANWVQGEQLKKSFSFEGPGKSNAQRLYIEINKLNPSS
jgi:hypothetical protein